MFTNEKTGEFTIIDPYFTTGTVRIRAENEQGTFFGTAYAVSELDTKIVSDDALSALIRRGSLHERRERHDHAAGGCSRRRPRRRSRIRCSAT